jgi:hypothetical protein
VKSSKLPPHLAQGACYLLARDLSRDLASAAHRLLARLRACARGIRLGGFHLGKYADENEITPLLIITKLEQYDYRARLPSRLAC